MGVGLEYKLEGIEHLKKLATSTHGLGRVVQVSWHVAAKYIVNYITSHMYSTGTQIDASGTPRSLPGGFPRPQTGNLASSISYSVYGWQGFEIYSNVSYAGYLQTGTGNMEARPYLTLGMEASLVKVEQMLLKNLMKALNV